MRKPNWKLIGSMLMMFAPPALFACWLSPNPYRDLWQGSVVVVGLLVVGQGMIIFIDEN